MDRVKEFIKSVHSSEPAGKKTPVTLRIPASCVEWLDELASKTGYTRTAIGEKLLTLLIQDLKEQGEQER